MLPTFHIARLNRYTPKFSGVPQKLTWCQQFGLQVLPKWGDANIWPLKKAVFRCFFGLSRFPGQTVDFRLSMSYIFGKLWHLAIIWPIRKSFKCILQGVRFLLANHTRLSPTSENDSYIVSEGKNINAMGWCLMSKMLGWVMDWATGYPKTVEMTTRASAVLKKWKDAF